MSCRCLDEYIIYVRADLFSSLVSVICNLQGKFIFLGLEKRPLASKGFLLSTMEATKTVLPAPITLTEGAIKQLRILFDEKHVPEGYGLRVGVKGGGCSGFTYVLGFDEKSEKDDTYQIEGITVYMEKAHGLYLLGMEIDWLDGLNNRGFIFNNPNAKDTCGCGTSFSA